MQSLGEGGSSARPFPWPPLITGMLESLCTSSKRLRGRDEAPLSHLGFSRQFVRPLVEFHVILMTQDPTKRETDLGAQAAKKPALDPNDRHRQLRRLPQLSCPCAIENVEGGVTVTKNSEEMVLSLSAARLSITPRIAMAINSPRWMLGRQATAQAISVKVLNFLGRNGEHPWAKNNRVPASVGLTVPRSVTKRLS